MILRFDANKQNDVDQPPPSKTVNIRNCFNNSSIFKPKFVLTIIIQSTNVHQWTMTSTIMPAIHILSTTTSLSPPLPPEIKVPNHLRL